MSSPLPPGIEQLQRMNFEQVRTIIDEEVGGCLCGCIMRSGIACLIFRGITECYSEFLWHPDPHDLQTTDQYSLAIAFGHATLDQGLATLPAHLRDLIVSCAFSLGTPLFMLELFYTQCVRTPPPHCPGRVFLRLFHFLVSEFSHLFNFPGAPACAEHTSV